LKGVNVPSTNNLKESTKESAKNLYDEIVKLSGDENSKSKVSYSFYLGLILLSATYYLINLGCGAAVAAFANMIVGSLIVCLSDKCL
jgi:hypothetical protein